MNNSPRNGFRGFFSFPNFSLRLAYCCFSVVKNHLRTSNARFLGSCSRAGATKMEGCSAQYDENSVNEVEERMKGGAVNDDKSPENDAIDFKNALQDPLFCATHQLLLFRSTTWWYCDTCGESWGYRIQDRIDCKMTTLAMCYCNFGFVPKQFIPPKSESVCFCSWG
jgi:hypothetical protein